LEFDGIEESILIYNGEDPGCKNNLNDMINGELEEIV